MKAEMSPKNISRRHALHIAVGRWVAELAGLSLQQGDDCLYTELVAAPPPPLSLLFSIIDTSIGKVEDGKSVLFWLKRKHSSESQFN